MPEAGQGARLFEEALQALGEVLGVMVRPGTHAAVVAAAGELRGQVFLDRDVSVEMNVGGQVGDAEAALAEHRLDPVFVQTVAFGQGDRHLLGGRCTRSRTRRQAR